MRSLLGSEPEGMALAWARASPAGEWLVPLPMELRLLVLDPVADDEAEGSYMAVIA